MQSDNPLVKLTGLWVEDGQPQNKAGLRMVKVQDKKWDMELQAGGCTLGRLWPGKEGGRAYATGSFLSGRVIVFKNTEKKFPDGPDFDIKICRAEKREPGGGGGGFGGPVPSNDNGADDVPW